MQPSLFDSAVDWPAYKPQRAGGSIGRLVPVEKSDEPVGLSAVIDFEQLPHALLATDIANPIAYKPEPTDKGLWKLLTPFVCKDELRPAMTGLNFDSFGVVCTDGHRLVMLPARGSKIKGVFAEQGAKELDYRFPDYVDAVPKPATFLFSGPVNLRAMRSYVQAMLPFVNQVTYATPFVVAGQSYIGFNAKLLVESLLFFEQLGADTAYVHISGHNKAAIISIEKDFDFQTARQPAMLLMPIMIASRDIADGPISEYPYDLDWQRGVQATWHFDKNTVVGVPTGKVYSFAAKTGTWNYPPTPSDQLPAYVFKVLAKTLQKQPVVPIVELVRKVGDRLVVTSDFRYYYMHRHPVLDGLPDGMYRLVNKKALVPDTDNPIDYPKLPEGLLTVSAPPASALSVELSADLLSEAAEFTSTDELRPAMVCINLQLRSDGKPATIVSSNGHLLYRKHVQLTFSASRDTDCLIPASVARLHELIAPGGGGTFTQTAQTGTLYYPADTLSFRAVDERYPEYQIALVRQFVRKLSLPVASFLKAISGLKVPKDKAQYWAVANKGGQWSALRVQSPPPRGDQRPKVLETIELPVVCPETLGNYEADMDGLLVMPLHTNAFPDYQLTFNLELLRKALSNYRPSTGMVLNITANANGGALLTADKATVVVPPVKSAKSPKTAQADSMDELHLRAMALLIIQRQRLRLTGLAGVKTQWPTELQLTVPGLSGLGELPDGDYAPAYARVRHLLSDTDRKAYEYYFDETADFSDFSTLRRGDDLNADWLRHKQVIEQALRQLSRDGATGDGYSQGRNFVGRHQKQTADLDIAQIAKLVREELAATYPDGKFSVRIDRYAGGQSLNVDIVDLPFDPFTEEYSKYLREAKTMGSWLNWKDEHYDRGERVAIYNGRASALQDRVKKMVEQYNYDNSDPMTDYFHVRFYGHVQLVERNFLLKYYPDSLDAGHHKHWEAKFAVEKKASDERAAARKGKFKTGSLVYYSLKTGRADRKGYLPDGIYLANVIKSPNGRGSFSSYTLQLLRPIEDAKPNDAEFARNMDARKPGQFLHAHQGQVYIKDSRWRLLEHVGEDKLSPSDAPAEPVATDSDESVALRAKALLLIQRQRLRLL